LDLRARYCLPARTVTVLPRTVSRTLTTPRTTRVKVPSQRSITTHFVPRTVAELKLPFVRNWPLPSPHSLRVFGFFAAALAVLEAFGQLSFGPASASSVI